jgi:plasmid stability protein
MGDLLIRNVPKKTLDSLKAAAKRHQRSLQAEALDVLQRANLSAGAALAGWLAETREDREVDSAAGIAAIRQARDER